MAYVVATKATEGASGTITVDIPSQQQEDDVVFVFVSCLLAGTVTGPGGSWQEVSGLSDSGQAENRLYYQNVPASPLSNPTITYTATTRKMGAIAVVVRGADVSTSTSAVDTNGEAVGDPVFSVTTSGLTLSDPIQLILQFTSAERQNETAFLAAGHGVDLLYYSAQSDHGLGVSYTYDQGATSDTYTAYTGNNLAGGIGLFVVAVSDNGNGDVRGYPKKGCADLVVLDTGDHGEAVSGEVDISDVSFTPQTTSITNSESSNSQSVIQDGFQLADAGAAHKLFPDVIGFGTRANSSEIGYIIVNSVELTGTVDLSSSKLVMTNTTATVNTETLDNLGKLIGFGDNTNASFFLYDGRDAKVKSSIAAQTICIDTSATGYEIDTSGAGSLNWSSVKHIMHGWKPTLYNALACGFGPLYIANTLTMLGGSSTLPCSFDDCAKSTIAGALNTVRNQSGQTTGQFFSLQDIQIGDGTDEVYWKSQYQSIEFPQAYDYANGIVQVQADAAAFELSIYASSSDTIDLDITTLNMGNFHKFTMNASTSTSATYSFSSCNVLNATPSLYGIANNTYSGLSLIGCKSMSLASKGFTAPATKNLGGVTVSNCVDTYAIVVANQNELEALKNVTFSGNNYSIQITGNHGGSTWSLEGATVSGGTGSYDIQYTGTGTLTLTCDAGSGFSTGRSEATVGTLTISAPTDDLTVNVDQSASQIVVYTTNTQTALSTVASGTQLVYTHSSQTVDITVHKDGYIPYRQTALALSGDVTVNVSLVASREYDSGHGLTYTTDASIYDNFNYITGITQANPAVVTYSGADNFNNNDIISIQDVVGMTEINGKRYTVANVDTVANTFELSGINSTGYTAYSSAGVALSGLSVPTFGPSGRGVFSLLLEEFRTRAALDNLPFPIEMDGSGSLYLVDGVEGTADSDIENMTACGVAYLDVDGTETARWVGVESIGTIPGGATGEYQQQDGTGTTDARTTGAFDEVIKVKGDTDHGNFNYEGHLVLKYQINGYYQSRVDVLNTYGISALEPTHYIVAMEPAATGIATGDPAITISITDHTAAPISVGGKSFDYEIVGGANSAEDILKELNYNHSLDATYNGKDPFNWPDLVIEVGGNYETQYGRVEGQDTTTTYHGVYVSQSGGDHPGFTRFQSNDGTYYVPAVVSSISVTGMPTAGANIRLQITNETAKTASAWQATTAYVLGDKVLRTTGVGTENTAGLYFVCTTAGTTGGTEPTWVTTPGSTTNDGTVVWTTYKILYYDADPASASYADTYIDNEEFATGDTFGIRFAEMNAGTSFKTFETTGVVSSTGFTVVVNETADSVYATNAVDGSSAAVTAKFTADYVNDEIDLDANQDFAATEAFAYYCYELTTTEGMYQFWGAVTAIDEANYRINTSVVSIYFDETAGFVKQTDSARIFRSDGTRPALDPTTGGNGIEINWRNPVYGYDAGGGGFTAGDRATLDAAATQASLNTVDSNVDAILVDTGTTLPATLTTIEGKVDTVDTVVDSILVDTGTTIPAQITALNNLSSADVNAACDTAISDAGLSTFNPSTDTLEGAETYDQTLRIMRAAVAGKASQSGTTETFRDAADTKDRITATVDEDGQRTSVTTDGT